MTFSTRKRACECSFEEFEISQFVDCFETEGEIFLTLKLLLLALLSKWCLF